MGCRHHKSAPRRLVAVLAGLAIYGCFAAGLRAESRTFTDRNGREITGEIVSASGDYVELEREGKVYKTPVSLFSQQDQQYIREWIIANPPRIDYHFDIAVEKKKLDRNFSDLGYKRIKNDNYCYQVKITNRSRETVSGLTVKYRAYKDDVVDGQYLRAAPEEEMKQGTISLPEMKYNYAAEFSSEPFTLDWVDYDDTTKLSKDTLKGMLLRIVDAQGRIVLDYRTSEVDMKSKSWEQQGGEKPREAVIVTPGN